MDLGSSQVMGAAGEDSVDFFDGTGSSDAVDVHVVEPCDGLQWESL